MHAHLPYVHHPEYDRFFEENWLFEAMAETYLPLVQAMRRLLEKGVPGTLNLSVSAPLIEMLSNERLIDKFSEHLNKQLELIQKEVRLNEGKPQEPLSKFYLERQKTLIDTWERRINRNLLGEFLELENAGKLNLLTCVGTHPFLPAYQSDPESIRLQLDVSVRCFERAFGRKPQGVGFRNVVISRDWISTWLNTVSAISSWKLTVPCLLLRLLSMAFLLRLKPLRACIVWAASRRAPWKCGVAELVIRGILNTANFLRISLRNVRRIISGIISLPVKHPLIPVLSTIELRVPKTRSFIGLGMPCVWLAIMPTFS